MNNGLIPVSGTDGNFITTVDLTVTELRKRLEKMEQERDAEARKSGLLEAANNRLRNTQNQLMSDFSTSTSTTTTTMTTTSISTSYSMSTMYGT